MLAARMQQLQRCPACSHPSRPLCAPAAAAATARRQQQLQQQQRRQRRLLPAPRASFSGLEGGSDDGPSVSAAALQEYFDLERSGRMDAQAVADLRLKYGIRRGVDGRVQLRRASGVWMTLKLDMEVTGTMLLRDTGDDSVHVLVTDKLEQVDLSDDYLLLMLFADGLWESQLQPITLGDGSTTEPLQMGEQTFKDFVGLLKTLKELEADDAARAAAAGAAGGPGAVVQGDDGTIDVRAEPANGR